MRKAALILGGILALSISPLVVFYWSATVPNPTGEVQGDIVTSEPTWELYSGEEHHIKCENGVYTLVPVATYTAPVRLGGKNKHYRSDILAQLVPVDLCVVWGTLAQPEYFKDLRFIQMQRWCKPVAEPGSLASECTGNQEVTHIHVIPATENILKALNSLKKGQKIVLEGILVNIYYGDNLIAQTSLTPLDYNCEILYVTRIRIENKIYK